MRVAVITFSSLITLSVAVQLALVPSLENAYIDEETVYLDVTTRYFSTVRQLSAVSESSTCTGYDCLDVTDLSNGDPSVCLNCFKFGFPLSQVGPSRPTTLTISSATQAKRVAASRGNFYPLTVEIACVIAQNDSIICSNKPSFSTWSHVTFSDELDLSMTHFTQITVDSGRACAVDDSNRLFCTGNILTSPSTWQRVQTPTDLSNVVIAGNLVCGLNTESKLVCQDFLSANWRVISQSVWVSVSVYQDTFCGRILDQPGIVCAPISDPDVLKTIDDGGMELTNMQLAGDKLCALSGGVVVCAPLGLGAWIDFRVDLGNNIDAFSFVPGHTRGLVVQDNILYYVSDLRIAVSNADSSSLAAWTPIAFAKHVTATDYFAAFLSKTGQLMYKTNVQSNWTIRSEKIFNQISGSSKTLCGLDINNKIWCMNDITSASLDSWIFINLEMSMIDMSDNVLCGVTPSNAIKCIDWKILSVTPTATWKTISQPPEPVYRFSMHGRKACAITISVNMTVYCTNDMFWSTPLWTLAGDAFNKSNTVEITSGGICVTFFNGTLACKPGTPPSSPLTSITGNMMKMSAVNDYQYGIDANGVLYYSNSGVPILNQDTEFESTWILATNATLFKSVSTSMNVSCAISLNDELWCTTLNSLTDWRLRNPGRVFKQVSVYGTKAVGVTYENDIYYTSDVLGSSSWTAISSPMAQVDISGSTACGLDASGNAKCTDVGTVSWTALGSTTFEKLALATDHVCGLLSGYGTSTKLSCFPTTGTGSLPLATMNFTQVDTNSTTVCGVDINNAAYCSPYANDATDYQWTAMVGSLKSVSIGRGIMMAIDVYNRIYYMTTV